MAWFGIFGQPKQVVKPNIDEVDIDCQRVKDTVAFKGIRPAEGKHVFAGTMNAPEGVTYWEFKDAAAGAEKYFFPGEVNAQKAAAMMGVLNYGRAPLRFQEGEAGSNGKPAPTPPHGNIKFPLLSRRLFQARASHSMREMKFLQLAGYKPQRLAHSPDKTRLITLQQLFGPTLLDLDDAIRSVEPSPGRSVHGRGLLLHMVKALSRLHRAGIIHCDIKPANAALLPASLRASRAPETKDNFSDELIGFIDLTASVGMEAADEVQDMPRGTSPYEAIEQVMPEAYVLSGAVDIWAVGATVLHFLTNAPELHPLDVDDTRQQWREYIQGFTDYKSWYARSPEQRAAEQQALVPVIQHIGSGQAEHHLDLLIREVIYFGLPIDDLREILVADTSEEFGLEKQEQDVFGFGVAADDADRLCAFVQQERSKQTPPNIQAFAYLFARLKAEDPQLHDVVRACMNPAPAQRPEVSLLEKALSAAAHTTVGGGLFPTLPSVALTPVERCEFDLILDMAPEVSERAQEHLNTVKAIASHVTGPGLHRKEP